MAYNMKNDKLAAFISQRRTLNEERFDLTVKDSVPIPDPRRIYSVLTKVIIADYTHPTYMDEWKLTTCKIKRPLQFLEFSFPDFELDPDKYKETPGANDATLPETYHLLSLWGRRNLILKTLPISPRCRNCKPI